MSCLILDVDLPVNNINSLINAYEEAIKNNSNFVCSLDKIYYRG